MGKESLTKIEGTYIPIDSLEIYRNKFNADFLDNCVRNNHPLNSALTVLVTDDIIPKDYDKDIISLLAMTHSKSTSGISIFNSAQQWKSCVDKIATALAQYNSDNGTNYTFDANKLKQMIDNPHEFEILQNEALALRDGDAMSKVVVKDGKTLMQDGTYSEVVNKKVREDFNESVVETWQEEVSNLTDSIYDKNGNVIRILDEASAFSARIHAGETNVTFESKYDGNNYKATITLIDPNQYPHSTLAAIEERLGEINTYSNCANREVEIVLPKEAENTKLA